MSADKGIATRLPINIGSIGIIISARRDIKKYAGPADKPAPKGSKVATSITAVVITSLRYTTVSFAANIVAERMGKNNSLSASLAEKTLVIRLGMPKSSTTP